MGFLDKVKEQGSALASKAQEGINQGQAKLDDAQSRKKANELLERLGAWEWAKRTGTDGGQADPQIQATVAELQAHVDAHGPIAPPTPAGPDAASPSEASPSGGASADTVSSDASVAQSSPPPAPVAPPPPVGIAPPPPPV